MENSINKLLNSKIELENSIEKNLQDKFNLLNKEDFNKLEKEIIILRKKLGSGENVSLQEAKKITVWFRNRRGQAFKINKIREKPKKISTVKRKKKLTEEELLKLSNDLIKGL